MKRREFIQLSTGAALVLGFSLGTTRDVDAVEDGVTDKAFEPNAYIRIDATGVVTLAAPRPDAGSDVRTSLPLILAEELDVDWADVRIVQAETDAARYGKQRIWGSEAVTTEFDRLRRAGATARMMLIDAAAAAWKVSASECDTAAGFVVHTRTQRRLRYGELVARARLLAVPETPVLKDRSRFRLIGRPRAKWDAPAIVTGRAVYGIDVRVPNMVYAAVQRPPSFGAKVVRFDATQAKAVPGVLDVLQLDEVRWIEFAPPPGKARVPVEEGILIQSSVAVIAENTWAAFKGKDALRIEWHETVGAGDSSAALAVEMQTKLEDAGTEIFATAGAADASPKSPSADYMLPFGAHATMEPMNCVADVRHDRAEFWAPVGEPQRIVADIGVNLLGLDAAVIKVNTTLIGGSFGRRSQIDYAAEAAVLSRRLKRPVKLTHTREDDLRRGYFRPMVAQRLSAAVDESGLPVTWDHRIVATPRLGNLKRELATPDNVKRLSGWEAFGGAGADLWYPIPRVRVGYTPLSSVVPRASWRGVAHLHNVFAIESFIDELAARAARDPLAFRRALLGRWKHRDDAPFDVSRLLAVIERAAEAAEWKKPLPKGWGRGIACHPYKFENTTYICQVVEVSRDADAALRVRRVISAVDCGIVINPSGATAQVEGASLFGLSAALYENVTVEGGRVAQSNFHDYRIMRMAEAPVLETHWIASDAVPGPLGEVATVTVTAALGNAIRAATGKAVRQLPMKA